MSAFCLAAALAATGCGGQSGEAPSPPQIRQRLTIELLQSLVDDDAATAATKISRLRDIDKANIFLAHLDDLARDNVVIMEAQGHLDAGNAALARQAIDDAIQKTGRRETLVNARMEIIQLTAVEELVNSILAAESAFELAKAAVTLRKMAEEYPAAERFAPVISRLLRQAQSMRRVENVRSHVHLGFDVADMMAERRRETLVALAILEIEDPEHPELESFDGFIEDYIEWLMQGRAGANQ